MVCPAFSSLHSSRNEDIPYITLMDDHMIDKVPLFGSGVHPRGHVFVCHSEHRVGDDQVLLSTLAWQQETVGVQITCAMSADHSFPATVITANSGVEVPKQCQLVICRDRVKYRTEVGVELFDCLIWAGKRQRICTDDCCVPVVAERLAVLHQSLVDANRQGRKLLRKTGFDS